MNASALRKRNLTSFRERSLSWVWVFFALLSFEAAFAQNTCPEALSHVVAPIDYTKPYTISNHERNNPKIRHSIKHNWFKLCFEYIRGEESDLSKKLPLLAYFAGGPGSKATHLNLAYNRLTQFDQIRIDIRGTNTNSIQGLKFPDSTIATKWVVADYITVIVAISTEADIDRDLVISGDSYGTIPATQLAHLVSNLRKYMHFIPSLQQRYFGEFNSETASMQMKNRLQILTNRYLLRGTTLTGTIHGRKDPKKTVEVLMKEWKEFKTTHTQTIANHLYEKIGGTPTIDENAIMAIANFTLPQKKGTPLKMIEQEFVSGFVSQFLNTIPYRNKLNRFFVDSVANDDTETLSKELLGSTAGKWAGAMTFYLSEGTARWEDLAKIIATTILYQLKILENDKDKNLLSTSSIVLVNADVGRRIRCLDRSEVRESCNNIQRGGGTYNANDYPIYASPVYYFNGARDWQTPAYEADLHFDGQVYTSRMYIKFLASGHSPLSFIPPNRNGKDCVSSLFEDIAKSQKIDHHFVAGGSCDYEGRSTVLIKKSWR